MATAHEGIPWVRRQTRISLLRVRALPLRNVPGKEVGVPGQLKASTGEFSKDNCFPSTRGYEFKNKSQWPSCFRNHLGKNVVGSSKYLPQWSEPEWGKKWEMFLPSLSKSSIGQKDEGNPKLASLRVKAYKLPCICMLLVFSDFRKLC